MQLEIGTGYRVTELRKTLGLSPTSPLSGFVAHEGDYYLFADIFDDSDLGSRIDEGKLVWLGRDGGARLGDPAIQRLLDPEGDVLLFVRYEESDPYTFLGFGVPVETKDTEPVTVVWATRAERRAISKAKAVETTVTTGILAEEAIGSGPYIEGAVREITVNAYERSAKARRECIEHFGAVCQVCDFDFEKVYGEIGAGFIHVHHRIMLSEIGESYEVDPKKDLVPVCPNCHSMIHARAQPYTVEELKAILSKAVV